MALRWSSVVLDCRDVRAQARWWAAALLADSEGNEFCVLSSRSR